MAKDSKEQSFKINEQIKAQPIRVIYDDVNEVMPIYKARQIAEERGEDIVMISENANPPVCRIIDYNKFLYQLKKKAKENEKKQSNTEIKELRFGPQTDEHDYEFKLKHAQEFLKKGNKVRAYVFFKGREIAYKDKGELLLLKLAQDLSEIGKVEKMPELNGKKMFITISPKK